MTNRDEYYIKHPLMNIIGFIVNLSLFGILYFFLINSSLITINCTKEGVNKCLFQKDELIYKSSKEISLLNIEKMDLIMSENKDNLDLNLYFTMKNAKNIEVPFLNYPYIQFPEGKQELINSFNLFLMDKKQQNFSKSFDNRKMPYICGGLLFMFIIWGVFFYIYYFTRKL